MSVNTKLLAVQNELKAPKNQYNSFGKYKYRSCEDILEGLKPVLVKYGASLFISDSLELIGERYYVKATVTFVDTETGEKIQNTAYARESADKRGMDDCQVTGATSSYARKYALNGLFLIDDTKDADTDEYQNQQNKPAKKTTKAAPKSEEQLNQEMIDSTDKTLIPSKGAITPEHITKIKEEIERTGIAEIVILSMFKVKSVEEMTDVQAVSALNKFAKTPNKKDVE